jgi:hypothetical protein
MKIKINTKKNFIKLLKILHKKGFKWSSDKSLIEEEHIKRYWNDFKSDMYVSTINGKYVTAKRNKYLIRRYLKNGVKISSTKIDVDEIKITEDNISKLLMIDNLNEN